MIEFDRDAVGRAIRRLRKERGQSQETISGLAGIARSHLAMIETGVKQPNFETLAPHCLVSLIEEEAQYHYDV